MTINVKISSSSKNILDTSLLTERKDHTFEETHSCFIHPNIHD